MSDEPRKRSRFDQAEPVPKRASRFDRRSRSPATRNSDGRRSRSPIQRRASSPDSSKKDPAAAAAAAAARINASLEARRATPQVDIPPVRSTSAPGAAKSPTSVSNVNGEIYQQDGDHIKDIEVNDLRNRYTLTKGATQKMIKDETGADVTTRGNYYPDKSMATPTNPPLYLHVTSQTREGLEKAVAKIEELMTQELPNLVDERRFRRPRETEQVERDEQGRRKWPEEKIPIDLEPIPGFNLRAQVVGHGGAYVKHIQSETRCRVQIKGRGSGFFEHATGVESDEPMYLHVAGPDPNEVIRARALCEDLLGNVKEQYQQFKERGGQRNQNYGGQRVDHGGYGHGDTHGAGYVTQGGYGAQNQAVYGGYGGQQSPGVAPGDQADYAAQLAAYYQQTGQQDPYAAYGGYEAYMKAYYEYYQQAAQQQATAGPGAPGANSGPPGSEAPPPPPSEAPPPPPPSGSPSNAGPGGYNSVPPPPGM